MIRPALARRIDRAARAAHAFHRWAHHPLCAEYAGEVLRLGRRTRVCRGCASTAAGALAGAAVALAVAPHAGWALVAAGLFALAIPAALRAGASGRSRRTKLATRALPTFAGAFAVAAGFRTGGAAGLAAALAAAAAFAAGVRAYRRRGPARAASEACPEHGGAGPCAGFREIARREAAFRRLAGRWIRADRPA